MEYSNPGPRLRLEALQCPPDRYGFHPSPEFATVFGLVMDWHLGEDIATIVAMRDGSASLYTTAQFGVIGGDGHGRIRAAAIACVRTAEQFVRDAVPISTYAYPGIGETYFYFLTYDGLRLSQATTDSLADDKAPLSALERAVQGVMTELRLATEE